MGKLLVVLAIVMSASLTGCVTPDRIVYASGFSFGNYDYVVIAKPDPRATSTSLYGMDVELANLFTKYSMKVIGNKELKLLTPAANQRTLIARMAVSASDKRVILTVSFDSAVTGRAVSSITGGTKGDLFNGNDRGRALEDVSNQIIKAMKRDRHLTISD